MNVVVAAGVEKGCFPQSVDTNGLMLSTVEEKDCDQTMTSVRSPEMTQTPNLGDFENCGLIDAGNVGNVYLCKSVSKILMYQGYFAMKILNKRDMEARQKARRVQNELDILAAVDHPFITKLYYAFQTEEELCYVLEYVRGGTLLDILREQPKHRLSEKAAKFYLAEILLALEYLHAHGVIYRDLKAENILIRTNGHIALTDFDLSHYLRESTYCEYADMKGATKVRRRSSLFKKKQQPPKSVKNIVQDPWFHGGVERDNKRAESFVGTTPYMAPEIITGVKYRNEVDWWSFGINMYEMLHAETPFHDEDQIGTFALIADTRKSLEFKKNVKLSKAAKDLLSRLLHKVPSRRIHSALEIKMHKFFKGTRWAFLNETPPFIPVAKPFPQVEGQQQFVGHTANEGMVEGKEAEVCKYSNFHYVRR